MPNLSHRISTASQESARAQRRIAEAEGKIARSFFEMLDQEVSPAEPRPMKNVTPPTSDRKRGNEYGRQR
jgi:hypothetical protein